MELEPLGHAISLHGAQCREKGPSGSSSMQRKGTSQWLELHAEKRHVSMQRKGTSHAVALSSMQRKGTSQWLELHAEKKHTPVTGMCLFSAWSSNHWDMPWSSSHWDAPFLCMELEPLGMCLFSETYMQGELRSACPLQRASRCVTRNLERRRQTFLSGPLTSDRVVASLSQVKWP